MKYPIGVQSFEVLRKDGYVYVDKTDLIYKLAEEHICFLSRPRRFGKSLLLSTLKAYFEGKRELFHGLMIELLEKEWKKYPVLLFDFNGVDLSRKNGLREYLSDVMQEAEDRYHLSPIITDDVVKHFRSLIVNIQKATGQKVVVLIDEYDKPLLDLLETGRAEDSTIMEENRTLLKYFFSVFKATDDYLRFVMLTGITKFSQVSMFSGFNQPNDITFDARYEALCGISEMELSFVFAESIHELAVEKKMDEEEVKLLLKQRYDGYHFSEKLEDIYNPFSIMNAFDKLKIRDYWFTTGTPSYLVRLLADSHLSMMDLTGKYYKLDKFVDYKADKDEPLPMIFQGGYLTIKDYDAEFSTYLLDFPNAEVKEGFVTLLVNNYLQMKDDTASWVSSIVKSLRVGHLEETRRIFTAFLAEIPYTMRPKKESEFYFHYTFYLLMRLISCYTVYTEKQLSEGRADCIVETDDYVYIFEFKLDGTAGEALRQIRDRGYDKSYLADSRKVYLIGASFSSQTGTIDDWLTEG